VARAVQFLFGRGREGEVKTLLLRHLDKVGECVSRTQEVLDDYLTGRLNEAKAGAQDVDHLETEADILRRSIIDLLYRGAFLPIYRPDVHRFVEELDRIADRAEQTCDFLLGQRPQIPAEFGDTYRQMYAHTRTAFGALHEAVTNFLASADQVFIRDRLTTVGITESTIDDIEWKYTRQVFSSELPLDVKMHLKLFTDLFTEISDQVEDAGDHLEVLLIGFKI
jgi:predicted phosphate transport protein (TIGR00153 family)